MTIPFVPSHPLSHPLPISGGVRLLASVMTAAEAEVAVAAGVEIIDAKDPRRGALGALDHDTLDVIRRVVPAHIPMSATTGDLPCGDVTAILAAAARVAALGVDFVKIGIFTGVDGGAEGNAGPMHLLAALALDHHAFGRRVAVLLADHDVDLEIVAALPAAGFTGVMLDTADKTRAALPDVAPLAMLQEFIKRAHHAGLFAGLAGALRLRHIPELKALGPDILGFRGALCEGCDRQAAIWPQAVTALRDALAPAAHEHRPCDHRPLDQLPLDQRQGIVAVGDGCKDAPR